MPAQQSPLPDLAPQAARYGHQNGSGQDPDHPLFFRVSYVIARLDRAIRRGIEERLGPHGLSVSQYTALSVLRNRPGL